MAKFKNLLSTRELKKEEIEEILKKADEFTEYAAKNKWGDQLAGKILASLFYEPSTRTRLSFETAMLRLGGDVLSVTSKESTSLMKGESITDTAKVISQFADIVAIRHPDAGGAAEFEKGAGIPVINAGDGVNQHPTQALLDLYTIKKELGKIDGLSVVFAGDLMYGRTASSLVYLLSHYDVKIKFISPERLKMKQEVKEYLIEKGIEFTEEEDFEKGLAGADIVYLSRIQKERFLSDEEYAKYKGVYVLNRKMVEKYIPKALIMHALPRVDEISPDVDELPGAVYFKQIGYGLSVRMALLTMLLTT